MFFYFPLKCDFFFVDKKENIFFLLCRILVSFVRSAERKMNNLFNMWSPESFNGSECKAAEKNFHGDSPLAGVHTLDMDNRYTLPNDSRISSGSYDPINDGGFNLSGIDLINGEFPVENKSGSGEDEFEINNKNNNNINSNDNNTITEKKRQQNRDAQRTFRERKKLQLKSLETQLAKSKNIQNYLKDKVEQLRKQLLNTQSTNRNLLKRQLEDDSMEHTNHNKPSRNNQNQKTCNHNTDNDVNLKVAFPSEDDFIQHQIGDSIHTGKRVKLEYSIENGDKLLTVPATWEYLQKENDNNEFDIIKVMQNLKGQEMCHGNGAAYPKDLIDSLIKLNSFN